MSAFYDLSKTPRNILNQAIVRAIVSENNGALFDPSDLSTLYQDAAGTIPVTAVEQPVGLMLDKARGMMLGPELVSNSDFSNGSTGWSLSAGWVVAEGKIIGTNTTLNFNQPLPVTGRIGSVYIVEFDVVITGGTIRAEIGVGFGVTLAATGHYKSIITTKSTASNLYIYGQSAFTGTIDNISVRELCGYHATQPITASRPTLSARKNILLATEALATQSVTTLAATYTLSVTGTGSVTLSGTATGTLTGTGTDRVSLTFTPTAGTLTLTVSGSVTKAQIELGAAAGQYQRVTTTTDYDTDERYFPKYLKFDGVDDYLNLPYMGLYANGSASVVCGLAMPPKTATQYLLCESTNSVTPTRYSPLMSQLNSNQISPLIRDDANVEKLNLNAVNKSLTTNACVFSAVDSGGQFGLYKNSDAPSKSNYVRGSPLSTENTTLGALLQSAASFFSQANLYGLIITKSALTDSQRVACERYLGRKSGVQL